MSINMLPVYSLTTPLDFHSPPPLPLESLRYAWGEKIEDQSPQFCVAIDAESLYFLARFSAQAQYDNSLAPGSFHEGLWNKDVLELFLLDDGGTRYQEINLSPAGAWWTCGFSAYRQRMKPAPHRAAEVQVKVNKDSIYISVGLKLARANLLVSNSFGPDSHANVGAMHHGAAQSWAQIQTKAPDFHVVSCYEGIELKHFPSMP